MPCGGTHHFETM